MVRKIDLHFPLGLEVTARNLKGVTIKDALDAIHKQFKKKVCTLHPRSQHMLCHISHYSTPVLSSMRLTRYHRPTTSWTSHTSQASSGIRKNATPASSYTRRPQALHQAPRNPRRRRIATNRRLVEHTTRRQNMRDARLSFWRYS
jgi:hypothetical protein